MSAVQRYRDSDEYVPWVNSWTGHLFIDALQAPVIVVVLAVATWLLHVPHGMGDLLGFTAVVVILDSLAVSLLERPFVIAAQHPAPGGWGYAVWSLLVPPLAGALVGAMESSAWAVAGAVAAGLPGWAMTCWFKPWRPHMGRAEFRQNMRRTQEFIDAKRLEKGWTPEARAAREKQHSEGQRND